MSTHAFAPTFRPFDLFQRSALAEQAEEAKEPSFALVKSGPPVPEDEVESHLEAIEVTARWGTQVLCVKHLSSKESFVVGEGTELAIPVEALGAASASLVQNGVVKVPAGAKGSVQKRGGAFGLVEGASEIAIEAGTKIELEIGTMTFTIEAVRAGKKAPRSLASLKDSAFGFVGLSFLGHTAIVACLMMFMPSMAMADTESMDRDQMLAMQKYLNASAQREAEMPKPTETAPSTEPTGGGSNGAAHQGESGAAGTTKPVTTNGHMAFKGADKESSLSRKDEIALAGDFGMLGIIASSKQFDPNAPTSPWGKEYHGSDAKSAQGKLWGASIDDAMGYGLGLSGDGEGGGGKADVVGDGNINTVGGGGGGPGKWGFGKGDKDGIGNGHGPDGGGHVAKAPIMRTPSFDTNGRLPAEVIQRIVRQNFGRFRLCYEGGLRGNPSLTGRVSTKFIIDRNGGVSVAQDAGSDLPDQQVVSCVVRSFGNLTFPQPEGGVATVTYPIVFSPGQ